MKTLIHPNNLLLVQYPNGQIRFRNCQTSVIPYSAAPNQKFPATMDLRVNLKTELGMQNYFKECPKPNKIEITWLEIIIGLLAVLLTFICMHL